MDPRAAELHREFVGAFTPYLKAIVAQHGYPPVDARVVEQARVWLEAELAALLETSFREQRRSPLEVFQQAIEGPTEWLRSQSVRPVLRDPAVVAALPGDVYHLAPASSAALGEEAFEAHVRWGAAKAEALAPLVRRPVVVLVSSDLMDRSRFQEAADAARLDLTVWDGREGPPPPCEVAFVDTTHRQSGGAIAQLISSSARVVAYGPHVDSEALERARTMGVDAAISRSALFRSIGAYLPQQA